MWMEVPCRRLLPRLLSRGSGLGPSPTRGDDSAPRQRGWPGDPWLSSCCVFSHGCLHLVFNLPRVGWMLGLVLFGWLMEGAGFRRYRRKSPRI